MVLTINNDIVEPSFETVPEEMRELNNWVLWQAVETNEVNENGERILSKVLKRADGRSAKSNDADTWTDFHTAFSTYATNNFSGIGFVFEKKNRIIGLDLDGHFEDMQPVTKVAAYICEVTYTEISPSGTGAHAYFIGDMPENFKKKYKDHEGELEIYDDKRFYTFTGVSVGTDEICRDQSIIDKIVKRYFYIEPKTEPVIIEAKDTPVLPDDIVKRKMLKNPKIKKLFDGDISDYDSKSEADLGLCNHLAFWTGKNANQMYRLFKDSELYDDKTDSERNGSTYIFEYGINKAIRDVTDVYKQSLAKPEQSSDLTWDEMVTFDSEEVLSFPENIFPDWLESYVNQVAESTQTPREMAAMGAFSALSIALTKKFNICVYGDWVEPLNTYMLTLMPPSSKKSRVFNDMMKPIQDYQRDKNEQLKVAISQNRHELDLKEKKINSIKTRITQSKKDDVNQLEEQLRYAVEDYENTEEVFPPTYIADDVTPEMLEKLLQENNEKIGIISAEGGLFSSIKGKYSDVSSYEVYLAGYSGDRMSTHRLTRDKIELDNPMISIGVFAQPSIIESLPRDFFDRGLMARFLYSLPKDNRGDRAIRPKPKDPAITQKYYDNIMALMSADTTGVTLRMSDDADINVQLMQEEIESRQKPGNDLAENDDIGNWGGKLVGHMMRLAGLIHMSKTLGSHDLEVRRDTIHAVEDLKDYFISHMKKAFHVSNSDQDTIDAQYLLDKIIEHSVDGRIKNQDLWQQVKKKFKKSRDLQMVLEELEERSFIKLRDLKVNGRGKPARFIILNPNI